MPLKPGNEASHIFPVHFDGSRFLPLQNELFNFYSARFPVGKHIDGLLRQLLPLFAENELFNQGKILVDLFLVILNLLNGAVCLQLGLRQDHIFDVSMHTDNAGLSPERRIGDLKGVRIQGFGQFGQSPEPLQGKCPKEREQENGEDKQRDNPASDGNFM